VLRALIIECNLQANIIRLVRGVGRGLKVLGRPESPKTPSIASMMNDRRMNLPWRPLPGRAPMMPRLPARLNGGWGSWLAKAFSRNLAGQGIAARL
jgi:hypothetical protein